MKKFRIFFDKDNENKWLNRLAKQGHALKNFAAGVYQFDETGPDEYAYQIDLYDEKKGKYEQYCKNMKKDGVEVVCRWGRWVYLRKLTSAGEFKAYTDELMLSEQYERLGRFCILFMFVELFVAMLELMAGGQTGNVGCYIVAAILGALGAFFLFLVISCGLKAKKLRGE